MNEHQRAEIQKALNALAWIAGYPCHNITHDEMAHVMREAVRIAELRAAALRQLLEQPTSKGNEMNFTLEQAIEKFPQIAYWQTEFLKANTTPPAQPTTKDSLTVDHALEQALTRLQKRYSELEAKVGAQPAAWVGLTDEERQEIWKGCDPQHAGYVTALVEAKLREKNGVKT